MIITVGNQKGGVGKTMVSTHLSAELAMRGHRVKLIDTDPQSSAFKWTLQRDSVELEPLFEVELWPSDNLHKHIQGKAEGFDYVIIDVPPRLEAPSRAAIISSDVILIPFLPAAVDLWASSGIVDLVREAKQYKDGLRAIFMMNKAGVSNILDRDARSAIKTLDDFEMLEATLGSRVDFIKAFSSGTIVQEESPSSKASKEVRKMVDELLAITT
jgi:chromosome partitioning protein